MSTPSDAQEDGIIPYRRYLTEPKWPFLEFLTGPIKCIARIFVVANIVQCRLALSSLLA